MNGLESADSLILEKALEYKLQEKKEFDENAYHVSREHRLK